MQVLTNFTTQNHMDSHVFNSLRSHLFLRILKNETSYLLSSLVMFTSLFFILFILFMSKEIFIHYSDSNSMLLPKSIIVVDEDINSVNQILQKNNISKKTLLLGEIKNYEDLAIFSNINGAKSLPKAFTLLSFEIQQNAKILLECKQKQEEVSILDITLKRHKDWVFKVQRLSHCEVKERVTLITKDARIPLVLKKNKSYAKLIYKANIDTDKIFYPFLISLEEKLFMNYFAYSKYFVSQNSKLSKETQEHAKMLNSLFKIIFAKSRQRALLNHEAYTFLTEYKKIPFSITPLNHDYTKSLIVLDELALNINNDKVPFYENLIVTNLSSLQKIDYDKTLIFCQDTIVNPKLFTNSIKILRDDFDTVKQSASVKINTSIYIILSILFILMLALLNSFISRNYKLYKETFSILIFHGFHFKIATFILSILLLTTLIVSYLISTILLNQVNNIFDLYYVDLIRLNFEYNYILGFFILSIVASYLYETKAQNDIINKAKGR